jgi:anaerobic magnesium-protoporphyrin IX monomethyl ester cyclase
MIDILLVNPQETGGFFEKMPPLGLAYIAANLEKHDYAVKIVDLETDDRNISYWLDKWQPRYLGISGTSHTRFASFKLAKEAKDYDKDITTVYGGVHATFTAVDTLKYIKEIDFVVRGEGEHTLLQLVDTLDKKKNLKYVRGITYRDGGSIFENPAAERIKPLDSLPCPAYHLLNMNRYSIDMEFVNKKGTSLITSRGCNAKCTFCSASRMFNHQFTAHSAKRVLDEIGLLFKKYGFEGIKIFDSTLTMQRGHVLSICDEILRRNLKFPWECEIRVGTVNQEVLEKMKKAGCYYVNFGIESASQKVLDLMRKGFEVEQAEELLDLCNKIGIKTKVFFSFGHIGETTDDVEKTVRFINEHEGKITTLASGAGVRIYPGTYLETYALKNGLLPENFAWSLPFEDMRFDKLLQDRYVPLLIQPQLGIHELEDITLKIYRRRFSGWQGFKHGIKKITDKEKLRKLVNLSRVKLNRMLKKHS